VLGFPLDVVSLEQAAQWAIEKASARAVPVPPPAAPTPAVPPRAALAVSFNPEIVVRAQHDPAVAEAMWAADLSYPDGVGAVWAATRQGARGGAAAGETPRAVERVPGIDLAQRILELAAAQGLSVYFLGAAEGVAAEAARVQTERLPGLRVIGTHHGYFSNEEEAGVVAAISDAAPHILLTALGAPRQELFLYRNRDRIGARVALGVGGSFDVWAGVVKRAPEWTQRANVEWLYRLASNPRRLRRQLNLPKYAVQVARWSPEDYGPPRRRRPSDFLAPGGRDAVHDTGSGATGSDQGGAA
jgi:N-acetylglucosaminyldiphosphoundecaprenol N-acetyl-beta-D-mannosaminyltransferase